MIVVYILFTLAAFFALAAVVARWFERRNAKKAKKTSIEPLVLKRANLPARIELSNHGAHMLADVQSKRQEIEEAIRKYQSELEKLQVEEAKIRSGIDGENALDAYLYERFGANWTIIAGYCAHEGEIDRILVGPKGVFAFEAKNVGGAIHCDGDRWWRDKTDRYGNVVERDIPIADNGGRSPSRQINDAADALERLLKKNGHTARVVRVVVFTNPRACSGEFRNLTVNFVSRVPEMRTQKLLRLGTDLSQDAVCRIVTTIRHHHEWFERKERQPARCDETLSQVFSPSL